MNRIPTLFAIALLLAIQPLPAHALEPGGMFKSKSPSTEDDRRDTIERIKAVQDQLKLLQDRLRALEKRKALESSAEQPDDPERQAAAATDPNLQEIDRLHLKPGGFGVYTYLLFSGSEADRTNLDSLKELILFIESLPPSAEPATIGSRFLLPVEPRQSSVVLARRPYDFKLSRNFLGRLGLNDLPAGPVLVSLNEPLDPYALDIAPPFLAVALGHPDPRRSRNLAKVWHGYEKPPLAAAGHPLADLFWQLLDGAGPTRVTRTGGSLLIDLAPILAVPHGSNAR